MLCAGGAGADACDGDSGGPLLAPTTSRRYDRDPAAWRLVGVTSWGSPDCGTRPGVFARLAAPALRTILGAAPAGRPPQATVRPALLGEPRVDEVARCDPGTWTGTDADGPAELTESIYRVAGAQEPVRVATGPDAAHRLGEADVGAQLVCLVSARSAGGQTAAESALGAVVRPRPAPAPPAPLPGPPARPSVPVGSSPSPSGPSRLLPAPDRTAPRLTGLRRACARGRCVLRVRASEWVAAVVVRAGGRRVAVRLHRRGTGLVVRTARLPRGARRLTLVATDVAGNRSRAVVARLPRR
jgi:hypothetical protein